MRGDNEQRSKKKKNITKLSGCERESWNRRIEEEYGLVEWSPIAWVCEFMWVCCVCALREKSKKWEGRGKNQGEDRVESKLLSLHPTFRRFFKEEIQRKEEICIVWHLFSKRFGPSRSRKKVCVSFLGGRRKRQKVRVSLVEMYVCVCVLSNEYARSEIEVVQ